MVNLIVMPLLEMQNKTSDTRTGQSTINHPTHFFARIYYFPGTDQGPPHSSIVFKECFRSVGGNHKQSTSIVSAMVVPICPHFGAYYTNQWSYCFTPMVLATIIANMLIGYSSEDIDTPWGSILLGYKIS